MSEDNNQRRRNVVRVAASRNFPTTREALSPEVDRRPRVVDAIVHCIRNDDLLTHAPWADRQKALTREDTVEGNFVADDFFAAAALREWATTKFGPNHVLATTSGKKLVAATKAALRRLAIGRVQRQAVAE